MKDNRSFFEKLTGTVKMGDEPDTEESKSGAKSGGL